MLVTGLQMTGPRSQTTVSVLTDIPDQQIKTNFALRYQTIIVVFTDFKLVESEHQMSL